MTNSESKTIDVPTLGMWLFIASEGMFFVALMGAFVVLGSQQHAVFVQSSRVLSPGIGIAGALLLALSSLAFSRVKLLALFVSMAFLLLQAIQWNRMGSVLLQNNFFGSYLLATGMHALHLLAGIVAMGFYVLFRRGVVPVALRNYWHFVNLLGLFTLAALYFV